MIYVIMENMNDGNSPSVTEKIGIPGVDRNWIRQKVFVQERIWRYKRDE